MTSEKPFYLRETNLGDSEGNFALSSYDSASQQYTMTFAYQSKRKLIVDYIENGVIPVSTFNEFSTAWACLNGDANDCYVGHFGDGVIPTLKLVSGSIGFGGWTHPYVCNTSLVMDTNGFGTDITSYLCLDVQENGDLKLTDSSDKPELTSFQLKNNSGKLRIVHGIYSIKGDFNNGTGSLSIANCTFRDRWDESWEK